MGATLQRAWRGRGPLACLLWPLSRLYALLAGLHRGLYRVGLLRRERLPVAVVVVGNVVAGGAGKTPVVIEILRHLRERGIAAGVVSRGYGRRSRGVREVRAGDSPADTGDEPLLVARSTACPVFVGERRADAGRALLAAHPEVRVIVSDDGLQHHALARDLEVCVFDERGTGNGWRLPAGPLREAWPRPVDLVLCPVGLAGVAGHPLRRALAPEASRADGRRMPLAELARRPLLALAGIARPEAFFGMLREAGVVPRQTLALPDHHAFDAPVAAGGLELVCTEKDAAKLWRHAPGAWAVGLQLQLDPGFWQDFDRLLDAQLSSPHGPQAA
ncbi:MULTISPECIES: tetraacyldisaccharide 4'-kinase [Ramlibacter]|uniref:Tetraacyldisaccharide 4'-kinase n=1 Tax=Ramlibacter aquaticus TaxID=2780094 RepID=A0ABR9SAG4_9BURK|nr:MULTISPECIES: tetraacyldisaccharide 4'-kinase [Ramlibacter]MBE7939336.1 tetraacyldisaccharide 4'-kinase [Ramlibacter aquaticus]